MSSAKIFSWNVNGVRSALGKGLADFIAQSAPDVLCLQECKCPVELIPLDGFRADEGNG